MKITYLKKANNDVISFCSCGDGRITFPPQLDCPWCGCGWLFTCITCRKAFTFAEGVEIECSWEELARADIFNKWKEEPSSDDIKSWIEAMKEILADVRPGVSYIIIDGNVIPSNSAPIEFSGWHAHHKFSKLPQMEAISNKEILNHNLGDRNYWSLNALQQK